MTHLRPSILLMALVSLLFLTVNAQTDSSYKKEVDAWHAKRIRDLKAPDGWLNLVGLYWLQEGKSSFGAGGGNDIVFPAGTIAASAGYFIRSGEVVKLVITGDVPTTVDGHPAKEAVLFNKDSLRQPVVACGSLRFTVIKRGDKFGIRLRDLHSPLQTSFTDIECYPLNANWRIPAVLHPPANRTNIAITNIIGQTSLQESPGTLVFTYQHTQYALETLEEDGKLFIVFGDATSGHTTYPSGRFLQVPKPASPDNTTIIDFNKAYNPPCAFTHYATCPLPPKENILPIDVEAGEKNFSH